MIKEIYRQYNDITLMFRKANGRLFSSSVAFFVLFAMVPAVVLLFTIIPYTPLTEEGIIGIFSEFLPPTIEAFTEKIIAQIYGKSPALLSISAIFLIWSSGMAIQGVRTGLNAINGFTEMNGFIILRLKALLYTLIFIVFVVLVSVVFIFGNFVLNILTNKLGIKMDFVEGIFNYRFLFEWMIIAPFLCIVYAWVPDIRRKPKETWKGAMFTSIMWSLVTWGFNYYVSHFSFGSMYGSLATGILIITWMYSCCTIFMYGGIINVYYINNKIINKIYDSVVGKDKGEDYE